jgi:tRNA (cytidine/uridine-2'-O-)-methyltransferase
MVPAHALKIVLVEPEIPQNTGNIARLCAATGTALHLVRPLGFFLSDKHFKRAGMDYLARVPITLHDDLPSLVLKIGQEPIVLTSGLSGPAHAAPPVPHWSLKYARDTWIFFGRESAGLPANLLAAYPNAVARIPMRDEARGLNVSTAAGIVLYEALRQLSATFD